MVAVDFKNRLDSRAGLTHCTHHALHLDSRIVLVNYDTRWAIRKSFWKHDILNAVAECFFDFFLNWLEGFFLLFGFVLVYSKLVVASGSVDCFEVEVLVFHQAWNYDVVDFVCHNQDFKSLFLVCFEEWWSAQVFLVCTCNIVDCFLLRLHALNIVGKACPVVIAGSCCVSALESDDFWNFLAVCIVWVQAFLHRAVEILDECVPLCDCGFFFVASLAFLSLLCLVSGFSHLFEFAQEFFYRCALDCLKNSVLLQNLTAYVERQVFWVDDTAYESQISR